MSEVRRLEREAPPSAAPIDGAGESPAGGGAARLRIAERLPLSSELFAEGIGCMPGHRLLQLTWREGVVLEYSATPGVEPPLVRTRVRGLPGEFRAPAAAGAGAPARPREMWGAAWLPAAAGAGGSGGGEVVASNGSSFLLFLHPESLRLLRAVQVFDPLLGVRIEGLNELEAVEGEIWANVYPMWQRSHSQCLARVDPLSGRVLGWVDLTQLALSQPAFVEDPYNHVLNGIAYDHSRGSAPGSRVGPLGAAGAVPGDRATDGGTRAASGAEPEPAHGELYVTGKNWDRLYRIALAPAGAEAAGSAEAAAAHVARVCGLYLGAAALL
ncbi:glutamine cyclotransferase-domain-containing protein [Pavlovales sp. CCMP2436]|nr:glutamine cyclotransferase-domain-containing protein [Pavlovales sp. CCMP2436]